MCAAEGSRPCRCAPLLFFSCVQPRDTDPAGKQKTFSSFLFFLRVRVLVCLCACVRACACVSACLSRELAQRKTEETIECVLLL